ncbi:MAG TPA: Asd/ArgC dimerization domain-containing protein [Thermoanaerobaculia bacterium]|nr:Asd/ArgC dimerization domain-containing protein [Thermoanaerobaculia bacterium]
MTRIGILDGDSLLGRELAGRFAMELPLADVHLFTRDPERAGTLVEAGPTAALLELADAESLGRIDALVVAGLEREDLDVLVSSLAPEATLLLVSPSRPVATLPPLVAGIGDSLAAGSRILHSPHAVTIAVALLLEPLLDLKPQRVTVTAIQPVSGLGQSGIDELVEQTRCLLTFKSPLPQERLGARLAFNLLPESDTDSEALSAQLRALFGDELPISVTLLRAGVFHGVGLAVACSFPRSTASTLIRQKLEAATLLKVLPAGSEPPGSADAAMHEEMLVTMLGHDDESGTTRLWCVLDHLVRGGSANAAVLLAAARPDSSPPTH